MIKETATVVAVQGDVVTVEAAIKSTCNSCQAQSDCGTGIISSAIAPKTQQLTFSTPNPVSIGQQVTVGIPEAGVLSASAWLYILPLLVFIATYIGSFTLLTKLGYTHELLALLPSVAVTVLGYQWIARKLRRIDKAKYQPVILNSLNDK